MYTQHVMNANGNGTVLPLWATCLGFEMLIHLASGVEHRGEHGVEYGVENGGEMSPVQGKCSAENVKDTLIFAQGKTIHIKG